MSKEHPPDQLVHIMDWPQYLHYVREDKIRNTMHWRPGQVNLFVADFQDRTDGLSDATVGAFVRLVLAYASAPLCDPSGSALGPRRLTQATAERVVSGRAGGAQRTLERLEQARLVAFGPSQDGLSVVELRGVESSGVEFSDVESDDPLTQQLLDDIYGR